MLKEPANVRCKAWINICKCLAELQALANLKYPFRGYFSCQTVVEKWMEGWSVEMLLFGPPYECT